jgi:hypothetical protein
VSNDGGHARSPGSYGTDCQYSYCVPNGGTTPTLHLAASDTYNGQPVLEADFAAASSAYSCGCARGGGQFYQHLYDSTTTVDAGNPGLGVLTPLSRTDLANSMTLHLRYYFKLPTTWDNGQAAKMVAGLYGGTEGGESGFNHGLGSFSTRYMERGGKGEIYLYTSCAGGAGADLSSGAFTYPADGQWHYLEQEVNRAGTGTVTVWFDGKQVLSDPMGCNISTIPFGGIFFSTFYGGHASSWGPKTKTSYETANYELSPNYIGP